ncbi:MAG: hypothetical protein LJE83_03820 [Gammaproteobacteria bacterium]|nr:hypothetical protein [Gammaproteobacteria bacterium]
MKISIKLQSVLIGMLYGALSGSLAFADDIEIYTGAAGGSTVATANILFVLDTSGSMSSEVVGVPADYDSSTTYTGCFDANRLYVEDNLLSNAYNYCNNSHYDINTIDQFNGSAFKCNAATTALADTGLYIDRIAQLRTTTTTRRGRGRRGGGGTTTSTSWSSVNRIENNYLTEPVECEADAGIHGEAAGDGEPYATDSAGAGGWQSGSSGAVTWGRTGSAETVYAGNYLNQIVQGGGVASSTRLRVMQDALSDVISGSTGINIGLMRYSSNGAGGLVVTPMGSIDDATHKANFLLELEKMYHNGVTPLAETYYEAVSYMQGDSVDYGDSSTVMQYIDPATSTDTESVDRLSHDGSRIAAGSSTYDSPISDTCQKNYIVLLTDGLPNNDNPEGRLGNIGVTGSCSAIGTSNCLEEIASSIASNDQSSTVDGEQIISTFTIGLDISDAAALLQGTANASKTASGAGEYYPADDAVSLTTAFASIVTQVLDVDSTFSSPAVSVNAFNRSTHLEDLYFTLFKPGNNEHWDGNLKKYKLKFFTDTSDIDGDGDTTESLPYIADANSDSPAVDDNTGFFKDSAVSYWTSSADSPDGKAVSIGGAKGAMTATRNVYTFSGNYTDTDGVLVPAEQNLTASANAVDKANASLTDVLLDTVAKPNKVAGIPYRETLLDWAAGLDVFDMDADGSTTDAYRHMGDPLHSEPALVQYGEISGVPDLVAYVATNDGYLHAFNVSNGAEIFSFIPQELLPDLSTAMENTGNQKLYGLDGSIAAWIKDVDKDGTVEPADGDRVYLYFGMRRGGSNIYAMDVTVRSAPKLLWMIEGGSGDYAELGDTWSTVNVEKVKDGNTEKTVLIFGGGYDTTQDSVSVRTTDAFGRAVFIADALTGERLWIGSASGDTAISEMLYSIPARVKPLDISGDGFIDRLYAVDMGGQIFRFDINNNNGAALSSSITGGRIADLADDTAAGARRFYYPPDVALVDDPAGRYHGLIISSGYRAHPLNQTIHDRIYMLKDKNTGLISSGYTLLDNLKDVTDNLAGGNSGAYGDATADAARSAELALISAADGWYIDLDDENTGSWVGEKGLSEPLIIEGRAVVTTYVPDYTTSFDTCAPRAGYGKVFFLDMIDATPAFPSNLDLRPERHINLTRGGIPPSPNAIITKGGEPTLCIGAECQKAEFGLGVRKTYWYEVN